MGFDGLSGLVSGRLKEDPRSGDLFMLFCKRLERGTFELPDVKKPGLSQPLEYGQLAMMITGFSMKHARKRRRF
jgi:transposase